MKQWAISLTVAAVGVCGAVGAGNLRASSHREAPLISEDPVADNTDVYAFVSPDKPDTVTIVANWIPLEEPAGGPNFYKFGDEVLYELQHRQRWRRTATTSSISFGSRPTCRTRTHVPLQHRPDQYLADRTPPSTSARNTR